MKRLFVIVVTTILAACGTTLPGKLYSLQDGVVMDFQIERSYGTGGMFAQNQKTGEKLTGQYTGTYKGGGTATTFGSGNHFSFSSITFIPPSDATARGVLMGDKGTVIELYMEIRPGIVPKGHGEGIDNKGNRYQVQF